MAATSPSTELSTGVENLPRESFHSLVYNLWIKRFAYSASLTCGNVTSLPNPQPEIDSYPQGW